MLEGKAFNKSIVKNITVKDENQCQLKCYFEVTCKSYNLGPPRHDGRHVCELSSSHHVSSPDGLESRPGYIYRPSMVSKTDGVR